ncbi:MAG: phosphonopyruvate decarboxylase [Bacteroidales bacterium]
MIRPETFYNWLSANQIDFFCGVPDSLLKDICAYITDNTLQGNHIIAANEGNAIAMAAGNHMATNKVPLVYMQNSGMGNAMNPLLSLTDRQVYNIPLLLMIGWRGEPGVKDEPQHITQGEVTLQMLDTARIPYCILSQDENEAGRQIQEAIAKVHRTNVPFAIVVRKGTFEKYSIKKRVAAEYQLSREKVIQQIVDQLTGDEVVVSTTGKTSRELFECREALGQPHFSDFLTVGSMGHSSQIALGIAISKPSKRVICLDGDGALLMHMGGLAIAGHAAPKNFIHIVINNGAHESVGGQPTAGFNIDTISIAKACGYVSATSVSTSGKLAATLASISEETCPAFIEVKVRVGSRDDLGRPTIKPVDNKKDFMRNLNS